MSLGMIVTRLASLNSPGKQPVVSDLLINKAIKGESSPLMPATWALDRAGMSYSARSWSVSRPRRR